MTTHPYNTNRPLSYTHNSVVLLLMVVVGFVLLTAGIAYGERHCDAYKSNTRGVEP